jgi:hypothetical protein
MSTARRSNPGNVVVDQLPDGDQRLARIILGCCIDVAVNLLESRHEVSMTARCRAMVLGDREAGPVRPVRQEHM